MQLNIQKLHPHARMPEYAYPGDAGMDLCTPEQVTIPARGKAMVPIGLALEIPEGHAGFVWSKSGLMAKHSVALTPGVIDSGYRGELVLIIQNMSDTDHVFEAGDKVAQILIQAYVHAEIVEVDELSASERGHHRFGSSGK